MRHTHNRFFTFLILLGLFCPALADAQSFLQTKKIVAPDRAANDMFGTSVAIDGDYAVVGVTGEDEDADGLNTMNNAGSAYIYHRVNGVWQFQQKIVAADRALGDQFGCAVSINGNYIVVGAFREDHDENGSNFIQDAGSAYIFVRNGTTWTQQQKVVGTERNFNGLFGWAVDIDGDYVVVGAYSQNLDANGLNSITSAGAAYIFKRTGTTWSLQNKIVAGDRASSAFFGYTVSIEGDYIALGAYQNNLDVSGNNSITSAGAAYIFMRSGSTWAQQAKIVASDRTGFDHFGKAVDLSGNYLIVGADQEDDDPSGANPINNAGSAYLFIRNGTTWTQQQKIVAGDRAANTFFARAVNLSGNYALIGAYSNATDENGLNSMISSGGAYIFKRDGATWTQTQKIVPSDRAVGDQFAKTMGFDGSDIIVGSFAEDEDENDANTLSSAGSVYMFSGLTATISSSANVSCNGGANGSATAAALGGTSPFTYSWSPAGGNAATATGLQAGTYTVTITDASSFVSSAEVVITQPSSLPSGNTVVTNVTCNGGSNGAIDLTATGGTTPYSYNWGGGVTDEDRTGIAAGNYSVTITDNNGCIATAGASVSQPSSAVTGSTAITHVSCNGGTNGAIDLTPSGGASPYTFDWGGGVIDEDRTALAAGSYSVTVTDNNGCSGVVNATISQPLSPLSGGTIVTNVSCHGGSNGSIDVTATGGTAPYTYNWGGGVTTEDRAALAAGSYSTTITDNNGCTTTTGATIGEPAVLNATIASQTDATTFGGSDGMATAGVSGGTSPYTYSWSPAGGSSATASGLVAGSYTVTITDANSCTATAVASISQPTAVAPVFTLQPVTDTVCYTAASVVFQASVTDATNYQWQVYDQNYGWFNMNSLGASGQLSQVLTITSVGDYNGKAFRLIASGPGGTTYSDSVSLTVSSMNTDDEKTNITCFGANNGTATIEVEGGIPPYSFAWSGGITATTATITGLAPGSYVATITDAMGCVETEGVNISEPPALNATISSQTNVTCFGGNNGAATVSVTGGTTPYSYSWDNNASTAAIAALTAGVYNVTITDNKGCTKTAAATISQPSSLPAVNAGADAAVCIGNSITLNGSGAVSYSWNNGVTDGLSFAPSVTATYTVTGTDVSGCVNTDQVAITVNSLPTVNAGSDQAICAGGTVTLNGTGATSYSWNNSVSNGIAFAPASTTIYTVTGTDGNGCVNTDQVAITVNSLPNVNAGADGAVCIGGSVTVSGSGATSYTWNNGVTNGVAFAPASTITYTVTGTDGNGCVNTDQVAITVNSLPNVNAGADGAVCIGSTVTLGGSGATSYTWNNGVTNGVAFAPASTTTYTVTGTDGNGCINTDQVVIAVNALPNVNAGTDKTVCGGASVTLSGSGASSYSWSGGVANGVAFAPALTATYTVTGTDGNGCSNTDNVVVNVHNPAINVSSASVCKGDTIYLTAPAGTGYLWKKNGVKVNNQTTNTLAVFAQGAASYTITYTDPICGLKTPPAVATMVNALPTKPAITIAASSSLCPGTTATLTAPAGNSSYQWMLNGSTAATTTAATLDVTIGGNYTLTVTDANGCVSQPSAAKTVTYKQSPAPTFSVMTSYSNGSKKLSASNHSTYQWNLNGNPISGATGRYLTITQSGNYSVTATGQTGCVGTSPVTAFTIVYTGTRPAGEEPGLMNNEITHIAIAPNPSTGVFGIWSEEPVRAVVRDLQGRIIIDENSTAKIDLTEKAAGIYILQLFNSNGELVHTEKLTKQ